MNVPLTYFTVELAIFFLVSVRWLDLVLATKYIQEGLKLVRHSVSLPPSSTARGTVKIVAFTSTTNDLYQPHGSAHVDVTASAMAPKAKGKSTSSRQHRSQGGRVQKPLSRKERRKQERTVKKQRKAAQYSKKKAPLLPSPPPTTKSDRKPLKKPTSKSAHHEQESGLARLQRKRALESSSKRDDMEISRLEKLLKIKRRKKLPTSFKAEGLDCIL